MSKHQHSRNIFDVFRYSDGVIPNTLLMIYLCGGNLLILARLPEWTLDLSTIIIFLFASLFWSHLMILMAYLAHECMHHSIFKGTPLNDRVGALICWCLGAGYAPYQHLKDKHMRHHVERCDVIAIDYREILQRHSVIRALVKGAQRCHIPAVEILSHGLALLSPWLLEEHAKWRKRFLMVLITRLLFFALLASINVALIAVYWLAYLLCIAVLGFMDAYQHTYDVRLTLDGSRDRPKYGREYEEQHTFSNLVSDRLGVFNLLVLNFCFHNVHHAKSGEPWYRLPRLHAERYRGDCAQQIKLSDQIRFYHEYRERRIELNAVCRDVEEKRIGAAGVSFLVGI